MKALVRKTKATAKMKAKAKQLARPLYTDAKRLAKHKQSVSESLPAAEPLLAGHAEQSPAPVAALYVPAPHAEHATPSTSAV